jgi:hypothetical protein
MCTLGLKNHWLQAQWVETFGGALGGMDGNKWGIYICRKGEGQILERVDEK